MHCGAAPPPRLPCVGCILKHWGLPLAQRRTGGGSRSWTQQWCMPTPRCFIPAPPGWGWGSLDKPGQGWLLRLQERQVVPLSAGSMGRTIRAPSQTPVESPSASLQQAPSPQCPARALATPLRLGVWWVPPCLQPWSRMAGGPKGGAERRVNRVPRSSRFTAYTVFQACRYGHVQHLEHLLFYGADMGAQNASGNTALHICALYNQVSGAPLNTPPHPQPLGQRGAGHGFAGARGPGESWTSLWKVPSAPFLSHSPLISRTLSLDRGRCGRHTGHNGAGALPPGGTGTDRWSG